MYICMYLCMYEHKHRIATLSLLFAGSPRSRRGLNLRQSVRPSHSQDQARVYCIPSRSGSKTSPAVVVAALLFLARSVLRRTGGPSVPSIMTLVPSAAEQGIQLFGDLNPCLPCWTVLAVLAILERMVCIAGHDRRQIIQIHTIRMSNGHLPDYCIVAYEFLGL